MENEEKVIREKTEAIEQLIKGLWLNPKNNETWSFFEIEKNKRIANVLIAGTGNPVPGRLFEYEVIWVNDDKVFIDLIMPTTGQKTQHQIWINQSHIRIFYFNQENAQDFWDLVKG